MIVPEKQVLSTQNTPIHIIMHISLIFCVSYLISVSCIEFLRICVYMMKFCVEMLRMLLTFERLKFMSNLYNYMQIRSVFSGPVITNVLPKDIASYFSIFYYK